jgi:hypothetical protein
LTRRFLVLGAVLAVARAAAREHPRAHLARLPEKGVEAISIRPARFEARAGLFLSARRKYLDVPSEFFCTAHAAGGIKCRLKSEGREVD